jgi:hypothetical protein
MTKPEPTPEDWRQEEQIQHANLLYYKSQQWYVANYGFLLFGALLWLSEGFQLSRWLLLSVISAIAAADAWVVGDLEAAIGRARDRATEARNKRGLAAQQGGGWLVVGFLVLALATASYLITVSLGTSMGCTVLVAFVPPIAFIMGLRLRARRRGGE